MWWNDWTGNDGLTDSDSFFESHDHDELTDFDKFDWKSWWIINNEFDMFDEQ